MLLSSAIFFKYYLVAGVFFMMYFSMSTEYQTSIKKFRDKCETQNISFFKKWYVLILAHSFLLIIWLPLVLYSIFQK